VVGSVYSSSVRVIASGSFWGQGSQAGSNPAGRWSTSLAADAIQLPYSDVSASAVGPRAGTTLATRTGGRP
jgi:hypothetical protein